MLYSTKDIIKALDKTHGMVYLAAEELGCSAVTIYRRAAKNKKVQEVIDKNRGRFLDKAELKLEQAMMNGEPWAIQFSLRTLGKHRGYVERQEITGADNAPLVIRWIDTEGDDTD